MISDKYNHSEVENRIYLYWEKNELFKPKKNRKKFSNKNKKYRHRNSKSLWASISSANYECAICT